MSIVTGCVADSGTLPFLCQEKNRQNNNVRDQLLNCPAKSVQSLYGPSPRGQNLSGRACEDALHEKRMISAQLILRALKEQEMHWQHEWIMEVGDQPKWRRIPASRPSAPNFSDAFPMSYT